MFECIRFFVFEDSTEMQVTKFCQRIKIKPSTPKPKHPKCEILQLNLNPYTGNPETHPNHPNAL